jgi:hypothetical protein
VVAATPYQNKAEHWDYSVDRFRIDVKSTKRHNRNDEQISTDVCLELDGEGPSNGWLRGAATHIAFALDDGSFILFGRKALLEWITPRVTANVELRYGGENVEYFQKYRRASKRKEVVVWVRLAELKTHLKHLAV